MQVETLMVALRGGEATVSTSAPKPVAAPVAPPQATPTPSELNAAVKQIDRALRAMNNNSLQFEIDEASGRTIIRVIDGDTNEVVRQFPSEEILAIARTLEHVKGMLLKDSA